MKADLRQLPANLNHWYVAALSRDLKARPLAVTLWGEPIVLFRDQRGRVQALEDRCPHRLVKLSHGRVKGDDLECAYHGWHFSGAGECTRVPYTESPPRCRVRTYATCERDGFVWLFGGDPEQAQASAPLAIPEWDHLNYIASVSIIECRAHFSYVVENLMDMYHGPLHNSYQAWGDAQLLTIREGPERVDAGYRAESFYRIDRIWSVAQLFIPALRSPHPEPLDVSYVYPHWQSTLGQDFRLYCLLCPQSALSTRAYLVHFTSLEAFKDLHRLPKSWRRLVKDSLYGSAGRLLDGLIRDDVRMIEEEQQAHLEHPERHNWELNRALAAVQRLIRVQADRTVASSDNC